MWLPNDQSRQPTYEEWVLLKASGWATCHDDPPCWHHAGFDIGNEPFTTDRALKVIACKHEREHKGNYGLVFCADCGMDMDEKDDFQEGLETALAEIRNLKQAASRGTEETS